MPRVKSQTRIDSDNNGDRRRQGRFVTYKSQTSIQKEINKKRTKRRN